MKIWNDFWGWFGDIGWLFFLIALFFGGIAAMISNDHDKQERKKQITAGCYAQGMVVIQTDAGLACADPFRLVLIK